MFRGLRSRELIISLLLVEDNVLQDVIRWVGHAAHVRVIFVRVLIVLARSRAIWTNYATAQIFFDFELASLDLVERLF